ncbi:purine-binding chemotaxis protein CheW [Pontibacter sp. Tf4]|uniref:chemotaxis protein CheW n=1 Tax=Pontibacter sp. Tf4 TaxID=2761620 RepID=UPI0016284DEB|nr:chemotaxis protein CheW [Pontibacter sp. Tf4]MBB6610429.1 purine-binding chemotaxis protein CheW [Pontibacter sp. Tf4]
MPTKKDKGQATPALPADELTPATTNGKEEADKGKVNEPLLHLIVFKLGAEYYGIKIEQVKEVTVTPAITRMPRTPDFVKGVANIRGDIIAIMDLEERFRIRPEPAESENGVTYTLVIEAKEYSIGVVVREVPQSLNLTVSKLDKTPSFLQDIAVQENYIEGIAKVDNRLIIVLDMYKILSGDEIRQLSS